MANQKDEDYTRIDFLGSPVDSFTTPELLALLRQCIQSRRPHQIVPMNASKLWRMGQDPRLAEIVRASELIIPEYAIVLGAAWLGRPLKEHVGGVMLAQSMLPFAAEHGYRMYFLGARQEILDKMLDTLRRRFPTLQIAGAHHGYFSPAEEPDLIARIRDSRPDILLVALGTPKQEYWIRQHFAELSVPVYLGVGGTFDVLAGLKKDAPAWVRRLAMEWLYRLVQDPKNLWKRYLTTIPWFLARVFRAKMKGLPVPILPSALPQSWIEELRGLPAGVPKP